MKWNKITVAWVTTDQWQRLGSEILKNNFISTWNHIWNETKVQKPRDLDCDLGSGQGHISMHNTCRTTSMPNLLTVASHTTEIRPFECREISTFREVWTLVIAFVQGNSKIGLWQVVDQVPYYHYQPSVLSCTRKWQRRYVQFSSIFGSSKALWPWLWIGSRSLQHTQYA